MDPIIEEEKASMSRVSERQLLRKEADAEPGGFRGLLKSPNILAFSLIASIGGFLFGYDQGVISGILVMSTFKKAFPRIGGDGDLQGWAVSIMQIGAFLGALLNSPLADRLSRKYSIALANVSYFVGACLQASAMNVTMMFVGRLISGFGVGQLSMVVPLYISEIAPSNIRGSAVSLQQLAIASGIMVAFWLDFGTQYIGGLGDGQKSIAWRLPLAVRALPSLVLLLSSIFVLPFSPRWLMKVGQEEQAFYVLGKLRRLPQSDRRVKNEMLQIKAGAMLEDLTMKEKFPDAKTDNQRAIRLYKELLTQRHLSKRLFVACFMQVLQQLSGINAVIYYAPKMFQAIGLKGASVSLLATGVIGIINVLATIPAIAVVDRYGRRTVLMLGAAAMTISHVVIASLYAAFEKTWDRYPGAGWTAAVFLWLFVFNFAYSVGCISWIYPSEIFPLGVRAQALGISVGVNWISNFLIGLLTPLMLRYLKYGTFYLFGSCTVTLFIWARLCLPETRGVAMEDMDKLWGGAESQETAERMSRIYQKLGINPDNQEDEEMEEVEF
ncbi:sugar transporter [Myxozyma melibiosi]|uniref:Sugar transporter n=1 Tax=Myxozyma melibiosi TaxID=54550 RepID=A0ABR1FFA5_9ASCO